MPITDTRTWLEQLLFIRYANESDLPALEWNGEYSHFRFLYQDVYQGTLRGDTLMWVAELPKAGIIGQLFIQLVSSRKDLADGTNRAYIYAFRIQEKYRNRGFGSQILEFAELDLIRRGFRWVTLNVSINNHKARRLYERHAYRVVADEPGRWSYLDEQGNRQEVVEPAWRMEKDLNK